MMQCLLFVIAVLLWLAITGEADDVECLVKFQKDDGTKLADLTLTSSIAKCNFVEFAKFLLNRMRWTSPKEPFTYVRLEYFLRQGQDHVVTDDVVNIKTFVEYWNRVAWRYVTRSSLAYWYMVFWRLVTSSSDTIVFRAPADESLWDMYDTIGKSYITAKPITEGTKRTSDERHPVRVFLRDEPVSEESHRFVLLINFQSHIYIMAFFDFKMRIRDGFELLREASKVDPAAFFVKLDPEETFVRIETDNWRHVPQAIKQVGRIDRDADKYKGLPKYWIYFTPLASTQMVVEKMDWFLAADKGTSRHSPRSIRNGDKQRSWSKIQKRMTTQIQPGPSSTSSSISSSI